MIFGWKAICNYLMAPIKVSNLMFVKWRKDHILSKQLWYICLWYLPEKNCCCWKEPNICLFLVCSVELIIFCGQLFPTDPVEKKCLSMPFRKNQNKNQALLLSCHHHWFVQPESYNISTDCVTALPTLANMFREHFFQNFFYVRIYFEWICFRLYQKVPESTKKYPKILKTTQKY